MSALRKSLKKDGYTNSEIEYIIGDLVGKNSDVTGKSVAKRFDEVNKGKEQSLSTPKQQSGKDGVEGDVVKGDNPRGGTWEKVITNESDGQGGNIKRTRFKTTIIRKGTGEEVQDQDGTRAGNNGRQMSWEDFQKEFKLDNTDGYIDDLFDGRTPQSVTIHEIAENDRSGKKGMEVTIDWGKDEKTGLRDNSRLNLEFKGVYE